MNEQNGNGTVTTITGTPENGTPANTTTPPKQTLKQKGETWCIKHPKATRVAKGIWEGIKIGGAVIAGIVIGRKTAKPAYISVTPIEAEKPAQEEPAEDTED